MRHRSLAEQHPILLGLGILFAVAFVITYWPVFRRRRRRLRRPS